MFPARYHNALFLADWSEGRILAVRLKESGASYTADKEVFLEGAPLNVCDLEVAVPRATEATALGDALTRVVRQLRPHYLCDYLYGLARAYNAFYAACPILKAEPAVRRSRLTLCVATRTALEIGLRCLNLPMLDRM